MRPSKAVVFALAVCMFVGLLPALSRADQWDKRTTITFSQPIEIPGKVLPAGTYVFKLFDSQSTRHIVQIFNQEENMVLATIIAVPNYRLTPAGETVVKFAERPRNAPEALKAWFYPGDNFGQEFAYPRARAVQFAQTEREPVPALRVEPRPEATPESLKTVPLIAITPELREEPIARAIQIAPPPAEEPAASLVAQREELPKTASPVPLIAILGLTSILLAFGLGLATRSAASKK